MARHHNRPTGKNAPGTTGKNAPGTAPKPEDKPVDRDRVARAGGAVAAGWLMGSFAKADPVLSDKARADLMRLCAEMSEAPGVIGQIGRGGLDGMIAHEVFTMSARFAAQAKAKEDAAAADPPKCHACGFAVCACNPWKKYP